MEVIWRGQSPAYSKGRFPYTVDRIVIHRIYGSLASADQTFLSGNRRTSAHYGVGWKGEIYQWVKEEDTAWANGNWIMNRRAVSIEHEDKQTETYTDKQYAASSWLVKEIATRYRIPLDRAHIVKHNEVVPTACPGQIAIDRIIQAAVGEQDTVTDSQYNDLLWPLIDYTYENVVRGKSLRATEGDAAMWRETAEIKRVGPGPWLVGKVASPEAQSFLRSKYGGNTTALVEAVKKAKEVLAPF